MTPGSQIAHYKIVSKLGEGGMGAVYRATDTKLNRDVAIKVLPDALADDPDYLARFTREAQVLASLNHPNIAITHGGEERALVMELVPGATLEERIAAGPIPIAEALDIARQIADALDAAHEKGVIHRDLKPANVKVTPEGVVKVLDFGLAKAADPVATATTANSPTLTIRATQAGMIMGTAGYMAPEQAAGKPVDKRADIWSYGVVLYEMLSGKRLFEGETLSHTLAHVLTREIDLNTIDPALRPLVRRCLQRDLRKRLRDIGDARLAIDEYLAGPPPAPVAAITPPARRGVPWWAALIAPVLVGLVLGFVLWRGSASTGHPLMRFSIDLGPDAISGTNSTVAVSPDGARIVYPVRVAGGGVQLAARLLAESKVTVLAGTEGAADPFFSPDSQWIAFSDGQKMKKVSVHGGAAVTICPLTAALRGASWGADDNIVFSVNARTSLWVVPAAGGTPRALTSLAGKEVMHRWPQVLPGGRAVLFSAHVRPTGWDEAELQVFDLQTRQTKTVQRAGFFGRYLPAGYLVYLHEGTLFAAKFDLDKTQVTGSPVPMVEEVAASRTTGGGQFDFSPAGSLFYLAGKGRDASPLAWLDRGGKTTESAPIPILFGFRLSPDGVHLAVSQDENIGIYDLARQTQQRVTSDQQTNRFPVWTADGRRLAYSSQGAWSGIWWARADGSSPPRRLLESNERLAPQALTPDGRTLICVQRPEAGAGAIMTVPLDMSDPDNPKAGTPAPYQGFSGNNVSSADLSPDGRWLAYSSSESGNNEVIVVPFPAGGQGGKWQVSVGGGSGQRWSRAGRELFYVSRNRQIMVVAYGADGGTFSAGKPRLWSETTLSLGTGIANRMFDPAPDGKRILVVLDAGQTQAGASLHVSVLLNFFDELKRRIP